MGRLIFHDDDEMHVIDMGTPCINCGVPIHVGEANTTDTCDGEPMHLTCPAAPVAAVSAPQEENQK